MARLEAKPNPDLLVWARDTAGYTLEEAGRRLRVQPVQLSSWEIGMSRPSVAQLRALAHLYKRPLAAFYLQAPPESEPPPQDFRKLPGTESRSVSPELRFAIRTARYRRQAVLDLMDDLGEPLHTLRFEASLEDDPERVGTSVRSYLGLAGAEPGADPRAWFSRWARALEAHGVLVLLAQRVPLAEMRGFSLTERPLPVIAANIKESYIPARTFTLLHEFAHVALGGGGVCDVVEPSGVINDPVEQFCNNVAGAALVPREQLLDLVPSRDFDDSAIEGAAHRFGVSRETVARRLVKVGRMTEAQYRQKRALYVAQRNRLKPKTGSGGPPPANIAVSAAGLLLSRLVSEAYDEGKITASDFSDYLGVGLKHLSRIQEIVRSRQAA